MAKVMMLTTIDNPFDPFIQFNEWDAYDKEKGYHTCAFLARVVKTSDELSEKDEQLAINEGIKEIIKYNVLGIYKIIEKDIE